MVVTITITAVITMVIKEFNYVNFSVIFNQVIKPKMLRWTGHVVRMEEK